MIALDASVLIAQGSSVDAHHRRAVELLDGHAAVAGRVDEEEAAVLLVLGQLAVQAIEELDRTSQWAGDETARRTFVKSV